MTRAAETLLQEALALPIGERAEVVAELLASLDGDADEGVESAWTAEIRRRAERVVRGEAKGRPWSEVLEDLERRRR